MESGRVHAVNKTMHGLFVAAAIALLAFIFASCSGSTKTAATTTTSTAKRDAKLYAVTVESTAFFRHGPQAGREPDSKLSKETVLKLIRPSFGYSKVEIAATGEQGYISSEDLRPASSNLIASASARSSARAPLSACTSIRLPSWHS